MGQSGEHGVVVVAVNYETPDESRSLITSFANDPMRDKVQLVLADNSPSADAALVRAAEQAEVRYIHVPASPTYMGAARRVLEVLVDELGAPLCFDAVVLCNVDLSFESSALVAAVADAQRFTGDRRWVLAPDIVIPGKAYRDNPQSMQRPERYHGRRRYWWRRRSMVFDATYQWLWRLHRTRKRNEFADLPAFTPMYSAAGAFAIFGAGYFVAGGVFHDAPLYDEEYSVAEQAHALGVPVLYVPQLVVIHETEASTSVRRRGHRQRYEWYLAADRYYSDWSADEVTGAMSTWFTDH